MATHKASRQHWCSPKEMKELKMGGTKLLFIEPCSKKEIKALKAKICKFKQKKFKEKKKEREMEERETKEEVEFQKRKDCEEIAEEKRRRNEYFYWHWKTIFEILI